MWHRFSHPERSEGSGRFGLTGLTGHNAPFSNREPTLSGHLGEMSLPVPTPSCTHAYLYPGFQDIRACDRARRLSMPAKSKKQQMAAGAALAAKRGKKSKSSLRGASKQMAKSMSKKELRKFAKTKRKNLPRKKRR